MKHFLPRAALLSFSVILLTANEQLRAQVTVTANGVPITRRNDPYYGPLDPPGAEFSANGLPVPGGPADPAMLFAGEQNAFGPFVANGPFIGGFGPRWGAPWGWGGWRGWGGWGFPAPYYRPPGVPFGYGAVWGHRYPRGLYWPGYRYGEFSAGPYAGFYGPAQATPGYPVYGPFAPLPFTAPSELPAPQLAPGSGSEAVPSKPPAAKAAPAEGP